MQVMDTIFSQKFHNKSIWQVVNGRKKKIMSLVGLDENQ